MEIEEFEYSCIRVFQHKQVSHIYPFSYLEKEKYLSFRVCRIWFDMPYRIFAQTDFTFNIKDKVYINMRLNCLMGTGLFKSEDSTRLNVMYDPNGIQIVCVPGQEKEFSAVFYSDDEHPQSRSVLVMQGILRREL